MVGWPWGQAVGRLDLARARTKGLGWRLDLESSGVPRPWEEGGAAAEGGRLCVCDKVGKEALWALSCSLPIPPGVTVTGVRVLHSALLRRVRMTASSHKVWVEVPPVPLPRPTSGRMGGQSRETAQVRYLIHGKTRFTKSPPPPAPQGLPPGDQHSSLRWTGQEMKLILSVGIVGILCLSLGSFFYFICLLGWYCPWCFSLIPFTKLAPWKYFTERHHLRLWRTVGSHLVPPPASTGLSPQRCATCGPAGTEPGAGAFLNVFVFLVNSFLTKSFASIYCGFKITDKQ